MCGREGGRYKRICVRFGATACAAASIARSAFPGQSPGQKIVERAFARKHCLDQLFPGSPPRTGDHALYTV
jgi:hypothetical protein